MNTMKKCDIEAELKQIDRMIVQGATNIFLPFVQMFGMISRRMFLADEHQKVTPKSAPPIPMEPEAKIEIKEEVSGEPV